MPYRDDALARLRGMASAGLAVTRSTGATAASGARRLFARDDTRRWVIGGVSALTVIAVASIGGTTARPVQAPAGRTVLDQTGGDLSEAGLTRFKARLDPAVLRVATRHDPATELTPSTVFGGLTPGWDNFNLAGRPPLIVRTVDGLRALRLNASIPVAQGALWPARPFVFSGGGEARRRALRGLTQAVYYEAALEPTPGQEAVAQVVLNRVRDPNFPNSVCGVVYQGAERVTGCQFSFTCDGSLARAPVAWAWDRSRKVAERALAGAVASRVGTATHYHADYVYAWWSPSLLKLTQIGAHIFYRWKGAAGELPAFGQRYAGREPAIDEARFARPRIAIATPEQLQAAGIVEGAKTVEIDGQTRVVGIISLGGRRQPTADEIARINRDLDAYEHPAPASPPAPVPGATPMAVTEVGRPERPAQQ